MAEAAPVKLNMMQRAALRYLAKLPGGEPPNGLRTWQALERRGLILFATPGRVSPRLTPLGQVEAHREVGE
jgi:hypothetical protein